MSALLRWQARAWPLGVTPRARIPTVHGRHPDLVSHYGFLPRTAVP